MKLAIIAVALSVAAFAGCSKESSAQKDKGATKSAAAGRYDIAVTENGFEPENVSVPSGKPVTLVFDRKTDKTCAKDIVLDLGDGKKVEKKLPLNTPVEVSATFAKADKLEYACGMDMVHGTITVQ